MTIKCPGFSEPVKFEKDGSHMIAHGWTQSTGQVGGFPYTLPSGWIYDMRYADERGANGSHGGCATCIMTLVHLISVDEVEEGGIPTVAYIWIGALLALYLLTR